MAIIVTRSGKGSPLTNNEVDANFTNLNTELGTKANTSSLSAVATSGAYADLTGKPTIGSADGSVSVTGTTNIDLSVAVAGATSNVILPIRNNTGATLTKGTAVYISGATGQISTVTKAIANSDATSAQTLGLVTADVANNSNGNVTLIGSLTNLDTSAYSDGQQLYLSPTTAGGLTATKPYAPNHLVYMAVVEHAHPSHGKLFVKVQNGYEMDELHNVAAQTPSNNDGLFYNTSTSLWENKSIVTALGYTPYNASNPAGYTNNTGTVTSVAISSGTTGLTTSGGPITSSGTITLAGTLNVANGGTGATSLTSGYLVKGNGASAASASVVYDNGINVGVGTASPLSKFHINGTAAAGAIMAFVTNTDATGFTSVSFGDGANTKGQIWAGNASYASFGGAGSMNYSANSGPHVWHTNYTENMRLSGGNLGLGVIPTTGGYGRGIQISGDPASDLGTFWIQPINTNDHRVSLTNNAKNSGVGTWAYNASSQSATMYDQVAGQHRWFTAGTGTAGSTISFTQAMTLDTGSGLTLTKGGNTASITGLGTGQVNFVAYEGAVAFGNSFAGPTIFTTGNTERMRIDSSGNVGIGTSSPAVKLDVNGGINLGATLISGGGVSTGDVAIELGGNRSGSGNCYIDLHSTNGTDFESRIIRYGGTNGGMDIINSGTGGMVLSVSGAAPIVFQTTATERFRITSTGGITSSDLADAVGYKGLPQNQRTGAYTLALSDIGKHLYVTAGAFAVTIPADATLNFPVGAAITFVCEDAAKTIVPASGVALVLAGTGAATTGTRTLAIGAVATLIKVQANRWYISGSGVT